MKNMVYHFLLFINNVNQGKTLLLQRMMLENMCFCLKKSEWDNEMPVGSATIPPQWAFLPCNCLSAQLAILQLASLSYSHQVLFLGWA